MQIHSYKDLHVWQKSMKLAACIYTFTADFPKQELYGLTSQMRRSSISIPSNIAEGSRRGSRKDFRQFILIAYGSGAELETQLELSEILGFGDANKRKTASDLLNDVMRMLNRMKDSLYVS